LTQALGLEDQRSQIIPPLPMDVDKRDFRLPRDVMKLVEPTYPQGQVPDCLLGPR